MISNAKRHQETDICTSRCHRFQIRLFHIAFGLVNARPKRHPVLKYFTRVPAFRKPFGFCPRWATDLDWKMSAPRIIPAFSALSIRRAESLSTHGTSPDDFLAVKCLTLSLQRVINRKFPLQPHQKHYITQYEELGF